MAAPVNFDATTPPTPEELTAAASIVIKDEDGKDVKLGDLYKDHKTITIFIRHFLCGLCQDFVAYLGSRVTPEQLAQSDVKLVIIGCGDWKVVKAYRELLETPFPVYADASMKSYIALGMTLQTLAQGDSSVEPEYLKRSAFSNVWTSIRNAFKMGKFSGGPIKQLGGEFVLGPGNQVHYTHRMENTKGHSKVADLLQAAGVPVA